MRAVSVGRSLNFWDLDRQRGGPANVYGGSTGVQIEEKCAGIISTEWPVRRNGGASVRDPKGRRFESRPVRFRVTVLGKLLTSMHLCHQAV